MKCIKGSVRTMLLIVERGTLGSWNLTTFVEIKLPVQSKELKLLPFHLFLNSLRVKVARRMCCLCPIYSNM
uniref:Uncharacterized protein n=1 Tax=Anguilla anguilla TaxID=7936 RepID=A0A0E9X271_ANGAN